MRSRKLFFLTRLESVCRAVNECRHGFDRHIVILWAVFSMQWRTDVSLVRCMLLSCQQTVMDYHHILQSTITHCTGLYMISQGFVFGGVQLAPAVGGLGLGQLVGLLYEAEAHKEGPSAACHGAHCYRYSFSLAAAEYAMHTSQYRPRQHFTTFYRPHCCN